MYDSLFVVCLIWVFFVYIGYPLLLALITLIIDRTPSKQTYVPDVTIIIPAYNESTSISETITNKLNLNYPDNKLEIIVVSDESDDGTDEIVEQYKARGVKLIRQVPRKGKTSALNLAVPQASGEIVVFSDANSIYDENALNYLLENFHDDKVGYVTGKMIYTNPNGVVIGDGCGAYMRYENYVRHVETKLNSVVGVDGGIDAIRKDIYQPMNADQLPDFVLPLSVIEQGYRVVYEERALLKEEALSDAATEFRMRVRVSLRAFWALWDKRKLFNPFNFPVFSLELLFHKLLRYLVFIPQVLLVILNIMLFDTSEIYQVMMFLQVVFYIFSFVGYISEKKGINVSSLFSLPYYLVVVNFAAAQSFLLFLRGKKVVLWKPRSG